MMIICDSSALIALASCQSLSLLDKLFHQVYVTQWVYDEICQKDKPFCLEFTAYFNDKIYHDFSLNQDDEILSKLDIGEASAILLYQALSADYLLIDEKKGRAICHQLQLNIIGSLGILLLAKQQGLIHHVKPLILQLENSPVFFDKKLLQKVLELANE